ncbi:hypothetical protein WJX72_006736 [[Myrmecia] bisecta]|uniref:Uncharacterized protein n=1 Tax=[Myrmecia] bisecta TaxID=41462 RepID=A0AAW1PLI3_9CHLO
MARRVISSEAPSARSLHRKHLWNRETTHQAGSKGRHRYTRLGLLWSTKTFRLCKQAPRLQSLWTEEPIALEWQALLQAACSGRLVALSRGSAR